MIVFGPPWDAPAYDNGTKAPTPVGEFCLDCDEPILGGQRGVILPYLRDGGRTTTMEPHHLSCFLWSIIGPHVVDDDVVPARIRMVVST